MATSYTERTKPSATVYSSERSGLWGSDFYPWQAHIYPWQTGTVIATSYTERTRPSVSYTERTKP